MSGGHYENIKNANLFDCLSIAQTRIVPSNLRNVPAGYSEVPLVFHLKPETVKKLTFKVPLGRNCLRLCKFRFKAEGEVRA